MGKANEVDDSLNHVLNRKIEEDSSLKVFQDVSTGLKMAILSWPAHRSNQAKQNNIASISTYKAVDELNRTKGYEEKTKGRTVFPREISDSYLFPHSQFSLSADGAKALFIRLAEPNRLPEEY